MSKNDEETNENEEFDFYVINVKNSTSKGQFVFPKTALLKHGIISILKKEGKRGFRIYPSWDTPSSKQALKTQIWQLDYFYIINNNVDLTKVSRLYKI